MQYDENLGMEPKKKKRSMRKFLFFCFETENVELTEAATGNFMLTGSLLASLSGFGSVWLSFLSSLELGSTRTSL